MHDTNRWRIPLLALALLALLGALWGGLLRIGWCWPLLHAPLPLAHGPLIVGGFLGTLIGLERAVALGKRWAYAGPVLTGTGALALVLGAAAWLGPLLITGGSLMLVLVFAAIIRQQFALFTVTMGLGALAWFVGNALWLAGWAIPLIVWWWLGFLVITIVGERLELSRVLRRRPGQDALFAVALGLFGGGMLWSLIALDRGVRLGGVGLIALALWLVRYDIARRTVRRSGLTRFIAVALLSGYAWLAFGGVLALVFGGVMAGPAYDALLHAVFVGFVISMIFGHAPIIFPAVLRLPLAYHASCYGPLVLLHASLVARLSGDLLGLATLRKVGGLLNAIAILLFFANTLRLSRRAVQASRGIKPDAALPVSGAPAQRS
ncbi:MAG: hypothetical protein JOZ51_19020 [Chloroflexi bacterium]|nr:hypothetical protein [Chloroflexota bacterium]